MKLNFNIFFFAGLFLLQTGILSASEPGFDCSEAIGEVEQLICPDPTGGYN